MIMLTPNKQRCNNNWHITYPIKIEIIVVRHKNIDANMITIGMLSHKN
jgi:hypothetical protein